MDESNSSFPQTKPVLKAGLQSPLRQRQSKLDGKEHQITLGEDGARTRKKKDDKGDEAK